MSVFFTADLHGFHGNIMRYCYRPGLNLQEQELLLKGEKFHPCQQSVRAMQDYILGNLNSTVGPDDILYIIGDFIFAPKHLYAEWARKFRSEIRCKNIHFIVGNHDIQRELEGVFSSITPRRFEAPIGNEFFVLDHFAMAIWNRSHHGSVHLYGHSHGAAEQWLDTAFPNRKSIDVGIDNKARLVSGWDGKSYPAAPPEFYKPFSMKEIMEIMAKKSAQTFGK